MAEPVISRKKPIEEYFALLTQAIKLNSQYMDIICIVSTQTLYENALIDEIPFHKWHQWIETKLNELYLQTIYKKNSKYF